MKEQLKTLPNQSERVQDFFDTEEAYEGFFGKFVQEVTPDLEKYRESRQQSEEEAKRHGTR